jgi:DMSO/TMAO reductase YedYZ molybdopterin-dependent catalytic subunit
VIFSAADGYTTSLPLATIREKQLILAYSSNGLDLPPEMGYPFIVVAEEKFGYKWARWVTRIELSEDADYQGYWEQRGYDNTADIGK